MLVKHARQRARQWVAEHADQIPGFAGAFFHGSINWLADDDDLPASSDVDVMIVLAATEPPVKLGKFDDGGVLLEISYLPLTQLESPEAVLGQSHLAGSFHVPSIIADPTGHLIPLQQAVTRDYAQRRWVRQRCQAVEAKLLRYLDALSETAPVYDQVLISLFAAGLTTHLLLVAGLKNPTVRRRYEAVQSLLADYDLLDFHDTLLGLLGCATMTRPQVESYLGPLAALLEAASVALKTPFFFASDIQSDAHPIAIDGSRALIERGFHREAVFWIAVTCSRCMAVLDHDASPAIYAQHDPAYQRLLGDLGIVSYADRQRRGELIRAALPRVWTIAEVIMAANPDLED